MEQFDTCTAGIVASKRALLATRIKRGGLTFSPGSRVKTQLWGNNPSAFLGQGLEYAQSRVYQSGDDVKSIDWRVSARTGRMHTKLYHAERERPVYLLVDLRAMMHFGSRRQFKSHLAAHLAAKLMWMGHDAGDRVGALILTKCGIQRIKAVRSRGEILTMLGALSSATRLDCPVGEEMSLSHALQHFRHGCRPGSLLLSISDFHDLDEQACRQYKYLAGTLAVINLQLTDPLDSVLPAAGRISDGVQQRWLEQESATLLQRYHDNFAQRQQRLQQLCRQHTLKLAQFSTAQTSQELGKTLARVLERRRT